MTHNIEFIVQSLQKNGVGIFPFDTVYGLTCMTTTAAVSALYELKKRPLNQPFLLVLPDMSMLEHWVQPLSKNQEAVIRSYWPGPFTFVFHKKKGVSDLITAGRSTIAIRVPSFEPLRHLFSFLNNGLISTSLNVSGRPVATHLEDVDVSILNAIDFCYDSHKPGLNGESTIVDLTTEPFTVLRKGVKPFEKF